MLQQQGQWIAPRLRRWSELPHCQGALWDARPAPVHAVGDSEGRRPRHRLQLQRVPRVDVDAVLARQEVTHSCSICVPVAAALAHPRHHQGPAALLQLGMFSLADCTE